MTMFATPRRPLSSSYYTLLVFPPCLSIALHHVLSTLLFSSPFVLLLPFRSFSIASNLECASSDISSSVLHRAEHCSNRENMSNKGSDSTRAPDVSREPRTCFPPTMKMMSAPYDLCWFHEAFCSINDAVRFMPGSELEGGIVLLNNRTVMKVSPDAIVPDGYLSLDPVDFTEIGVTQDGDVQVAGYVPDNLVTVTLEFKFVNFRVKLGGKQETLDVEWLKPELTREYEGHVIEVGESVDADYNGTVCTFSVKAIYAGDHAVVSNFGLWTKDTHLILETPGNSGITITGGIHSRHHSLPLKMKVMSPPRPLSVEAYCSINDAAHFLPGPGLETGMVLINKHTVLKVAPDATVPDGYLGLSSCACLEAQVSVSDDVQVARYVPENLVMLTLKLKAVKYPVKFRARSETFDPERLKANLTSQYLGKLMAVGKYASLHCDGMDFTFVVKETTAGKQTADCNRGLWTKDTHINLKTPYDSGITITN